jgi:hypothetical protein
VVRNKRRNCLLNDIVTEKRVPKKCFISVVYQIMNGYQSLFRLHDGKTYTGQLTLWTTKDFRIPDTCVLQCIDRKHLARWCGNSQQTYLYQKLYREPATIFLITLSSHIFENKNWDENLLQLS